MIPASERDSLWLDLSRFVERPEAYDFDALALRAVQVQAKQVPAYGRLVEAYGGPPSHWREAPLVPTDLFRELDLSAGEPPVATFRTSGTTVGRRGVRRVPDLSLYHLAMVAPFVEHVLAGDRTARPWLALVLDEPDSSLGHMVRELGQGLASRVRWALDRDGLDAKAALRALATDEPLIVLTTAFGLVMLLDSLGPRVPRLPAGSRLMLTGGFKGRSREVAEDELLRELQERLGLPPAAVIGEYGMTELTSQAYAPGAGEPFVSPPWLRLRVVDPADLVDQPPGTEGLVACFDLMNLDNVSAILTGDRGVLDPGGGLRLLGRAPGAVLRGCSLGAEELMLP